MPLMTWNDAFTVSVPEIDSEHKRLVALINELHDAMKAGQANDVLDGIFAALVDYTVHHFAHEERLMAAASYPLYPVHKRQHDELTAEVAELQRKFAGNRHATVTLETMTFLKDWLATHIMDTDKRMGEYLAARTPATTRPRL